MATLRGDLRGRGEQRIGKAGGCVRSCSRRPAAGRDLGVGFGIPISSRIVPNLGGIDPLPHPDWPVGPESRYRDFENRTRVERVRTAIEETTTLVRERLWIRAWAAAPARNVGRPRGADARPLRGAGLPPALLLRVALLRMAAPASMSAPTRKWRAPPKRLPEQSGSRGTPLPPRAPAPCRLDGAARCVPLPSSDRRGSRHPVPRPPLRARRAA